MRVIAGSARRVSLMTPAGMETRPTTDRIKETLFNMIQNEVTDSSFLDLFSGSGGIGIEAISRGAKKAVFVEKSKNALFCIYENLAKTKFEEKAKVITSDAVLAISKLMKMQENFDLVFMDPPYDKGWEEKILMEISKNHILNENALIIVEASLNTTVDYVYDMGYDIEKIKKYKTNQHIFIRKKQ